MIKTIADTVVWLADERMKTCAYQNRNSAIHATMLDVSLELCKVMAKGGEENETTCVEDTDSGGSSVGCPGIVDHP